MEVTSGIAAYTRKLLLNFDKIRGKNKNDFSQPFWDVVVLTSADDEQRLAYELQIQAKLERGELPRGVVYKVISDPPGPRAGCGGSTMHVIAELTKMYHQQLDELRVLLINAGGQSQRLPSSSILGKIFMALPLGGASGCSMYQLLDFKLACYLPILERMSPGYLHVASDTIEVFDLGQDLIGQRRCRSMDGEAGPASKGEANGFDTGRTCSGDTHAEGADGNNTSQTTRGESHAETWTFRKPGFTAAAHPSSLQIGKGHGVYVLSESTETRSNDHELVEMKPCVEVLQKPSEARMRERGAVIIDINNKLSGTPGKCATEFVYTDSFFSFDHEVARGLLKFLQENGPLHCEIDAYGDFLQALGPKASIDYTQDTKNVGTLEPKLEETRRGIFHALKGTPLNVVVMNSSKFYHLGTAAEYLDSYCEDEAMAAELGFQRHVFSAIKEFPQVPRAETNDTKRQKRESQLLGCVLHSHVHAASRSRTRSIVEYCNFDVPVVVGENCVISNCAITGDSTKGKGRGEVKIIDGAFLHTVAVKDLDDNAGGGSVTKWITVCYHCDDDLKQKVPGERIKDLSYFKKGIEERAAQWNFGSASDLFDRAEERFSMWAARLFPAMPTMSESFLFAIDMLEHIGSGESFDLGSHGRRYSMADVMQRKDVHATLKYREALYLKIKDDLL